MRVPMFGTALAATLGLMLGAATAQQPGTTQQRNQQQNLFNDQSTTRQQIDQRSQTARSQKSVVRASKVIGMEVKNNRDEELGAIEDLAIDPNTGRVVYAAVSMGGFLGVGDKLFAVPWEAIECRPEQGSTATGESAEHVAVLNVSKEQLKNAQGFDQDNWPDMANERWQQQNDRHYQSARRVDRTRER